VLVSSIKYVVTITIKKEFTYRQSDRQLDNSFERGNTVLHEHVHIKKTQKSRKFNERTSELCERAINSKTRSQCHLSFRRMKERL